MSDNPRRRAIRHVPPLPSPIRRSRRGEPARDSFSVELETVTPILGGAPVPRTVDEIDVIRAPTIRGHLRFWWRALYGGRYQTPGKLFEAESALWGKAGDDKDNARARSSVEISVEMLRPSQIDNHPIEANDEDGYALWPAREPLAQRRRAGVRFRLTVSTSQDRLDAVKDVVRAWVLFGGYGSRTRRGLGSLRVSDRRMERQWLPSVEYADELEPEELKREFEESFDQLFGRKLFAESSESRQTPSLSGAVLLIGGLRRDQPQQAWLEALHWLRDFRQQPGLAREPGRPPGRSRWPESDKIRLLTGKDGHPPRYADRTAAWPRAEFGLPIVGRFQGRNEPDDFLLTWQIDAREATPEENRIKDRLASPLIVKPLQTVQGFYPCALWLNRAFPPGEVIVDGLPHSNAPFGFLGTRSDLAKAASLRAPFARKPNVKVAFLDWVKTKDGVVQVAP